ncbi:MAG: hypothetical protein M1825_005450 [Sarcosagium campestre]|nr:MAG: hypothetical protein M1825_005450 [Sarcosagium campestre]
MGRDLWCHNNITVPVGTPAGLHALYWVLDWPTLPTSPDDPSGRPQIFTTCMDIEVISSNGASDLDTTTASDTSTTRTTTSTISTTSTSDLDTTITSETTTTDTSSS